jgi:hypothetical protein
LNSGKDSLRSEWNAEWHTDYTDFTENHGFRCAQNRTQSKRNDGMAEYYGIIIQFNFQ